MFAALHRKESDTEGISGVERLKEALREAGAVIVGAGAGLSASAGFVYTGERFDRYFRDFAGKYSFSDMYSGGFYPYDTLEEHWAYWSRYIYINRYMDALKPVYEQLYRLLSGREYFVLTTNVDHCFQKAGFDKERLFYTQGDYGLFQCSRPCHLDTYDNEEIPHCPRCGSPMSMNLRADDTFVEDAGWHRAAGRYQEFLHRYQKGKVLFLELAVGYNTPGIIKYPFWQMTYQNPEATYVCINYGDAAAPKEIAERSVCIDGDIGDVLKKLK